MAKLTLYTPKIYFEDKEIKNPKEIARIVKSQISNLGHFDVYYGSPPKKWWKKILYFMTTGMN